MPRSGSSPERPCAARGCQGAGVRGSGVAEGQSVARAGSAKGQWCRGAGGRVRHGAGVQMWILVGRFTLMGDGKWLPHRVIFTYQPNGSGKGEGAGATASTKFNSPAEHTESRPRQRVANQ